MPLIVHPREILIPQQSHTLTLRKHTKGCHFWHLFSCPIGVNSGNQKLPILPTQSLTPDPFDIAPAFPGFNLGQDSEA